MIGHHRPRGHNETREEFQTRALEWLLDVTNRIILPGIEEFRKGQMKMDEDIKQAIDDVAELKSVVQSNNAAFKVLTDMNTTQAATIADLEAKIAAGSGVTVEDMAALKASNVDFGQALVDLKANVPANTGGK